MDLKKLLQSGLIYTIGNIMVKGLTFFAIPLYTRIMPQDVYGEFSLYSSWVAILSIIIGLQTASSLNIGKRDFPENYNKYAATSLTISSIAFFIIFWIAFIFKVQLSNIFGFSDTLVLILIIQSYYSYIVTFVNSYLVYEQKSKTYTGISFIYTFFNVLISVILVKLMPDAKLVAMIFGLFIPSLILTVGFYLFLYGKTKILIEKKHVRIIFVLSLPIIIHLLGHQILMQLDRIMINQYLGPSKNAIYSFGYSLALIINVIWSSLNNAWVPWYFEEEKKGNMKTINAYSEIYIIGYTLVTIGFVGLVPEVVKIMGKPEYYSSIYFIPFLVMSYYFVFLYSFPVNVQFLKKNTKLIPIGTVLAAVINYILNLFYIKKFGIMGAAVSTLISYAFLFIFHHIVSRVRYKYTEVSLKEYFVWTVYTLVQVGLLYVFIPIIWIRYVIVLLNCLLLAVIIRKKIKKLRSCY